MSATLSQRLLQALSKVDRPSSFCAEGSAAAVLPGLDIHGIGPIGFPLTAKQAKEIKKHAQPAPYGKGEQTLVDPKVRRVWRLTPEQFKLTNPEWETFLEQTLKAVRENLGLEKQKLEAHLYDLLLYEKGCFFLPHRDGEKLDRMVATLVVALPSHYEGGELVVRHEGQEKILALGSPDDRGFRVHFAAFYADCEHEVRPLREGYRLCLIYNLTLAKARKAIHAPRMAEHVEAVREVLREWTAVDEPHKLAVTLAHQYTADGLGWDVLKGVDRARADVLREAARQSGCTAYLALLTLWESGSAVDDGSSYYGRRDRWRGYKEPEDSGHHEMEEVYDSSLTAEHWTNDEGGKVRLGKMVVEPEEVVPEDSLRKVEPKEDFEGYTGNAGMTLERWYHHAAILLWPEKRHFQVLAFGSENPIAAFGPLVEKWRQAGPQKAAELKTQCLEFARHLIAGWRSVSHCYTEAKAAPHEIVPALTVLDEPKLIRDFLGQVMPKDATVDVSMPFLKRCETHGWVTFQQAFQAIFQVGTIGMLPRNVRLLEQLGTGKWKRTPEWQTLCGRAAQEILTALRAIDLAADDWQSRSLNRSEILAGLVRALSAANMIETLTQLLDHVAATPKPYPLNDVQINALLALQPWLPKHLDQPCPPLSRWLASCREQLESLTAQIPAPPTDFRREANLSCHCKLCQELSRFLTDPNEEVHRFKTPEDNRSHLENHIRHDCCDVNCVTERRGTPHTLACTKNTASFERRLRQYHLDLEHLAALRSMEAHGKR